MRRHRRREHRHSGLAAALVTLVLFCSRWSVLDKVIDALEMNKPNGKHWGQNGLVAFSAGFVNVVVTLVSLCSHIQQYYVLVNEMVIWT